MGFGIWVFESLWVLAFEFLWVLDFGEKEKKMGRGVEEEGEMAISVGFQQWRKEEEEMAMLGFCFLSGGLWSLTF